MKRNWDRIFLNLYVVVCILLVCLSVYQNIKYEKLVNGEVSDYSNEYVFVNESVLLELDKLTFNNNEQGLCLTGYNNTITGFYYSESRSNTTQIDMSCEQDGTIGKAHTHPPPLGSCRMSWTDMKTTWLNGRTYEVIVCGHGKYGVYTLESYHMPLRIVVMNHHKK